MSAGSDAFSNDRLNKADDKVRDGGSTLAGDAKQAAKEAGKVASDFGAIAADAARATFDAASSQAAELAKGVAGELGETADQQKRRGAESIRTFAGAIKSAAGEMESESPMVARHFRNAAGKVEEFSDDLKDRSINELYRTATDFARRQPVSFFAGAMVAGFALSRFLKSQHAEGPADNGADAFRASGAGMPRAASQQTPPPATRPATTTPGSQPYTPGGATNPTPVTQPRKAGF